MGFKLARITKELKCLFRQFRFSRLEIMEPDEPFSHSIQIG